jgi:hypothetical protein
MEKSSKRGKIPQQDWPSIITRHEAGETLASIARTYDCSPPAISYIVSRSRARRSADEPAPAIPVTPAEPQLVKIHPSPPASAEPPRPPAHSPQPTPDSPTAVPPRAGNGDAGRALLGHSEAHPGGNSASQPAFRSNAPPPGNGDSRRTLHLSLGNGGGGRQPYLPPSNPAGPGDRFPPRQGAERFERPPAERREPAFAAPAANPAEPPAEPPAARNGGGAFLDRALRERVDADIAAFLAAFDAALAGDTVESRTGLREATDRLLRAGARTRIELERLEARTPLPPRDKAAQGAAAWRPR